MDFGPPVVARASRGTGRVDGRWDASGHLGRRDHRRCASSASGGDHGNDQRRRSKRSTAQGASHYSSPRCAAQRGSVIKACVARSDDISRSDGFHGTLVPVNELARPWPTDAVGDVVQRSRCHLPPRCATAPNSHSGVVGTGTDLTGLEPESTGQGSTDRTTIRGADRKGCGDAAH